MFIYLFRLFNSIMKNSSYLACLLFITGIILVLGFVNSAHATENLGYDSFSENKINDPRYELDVPQSYSVTGYRNKNYTFSIELKNPALFDLNKSCLRFYWDINNISDNDFFFMNDKSHFQSPNVWNASHIWARNGEYYISVGVFNYSSANHPAYYTSGIPINIKEPIEFNISSISMTNESSQNKQEITLYSLSFLPQISNSSANKNYYCAYADNSYDFNVWYKINTNRLNDYDNRSINETLTFVKWSEISIDYDYDLFDIVIRKNISNHNITNSPYEFSDPFPHVWNQTGVQEINVTACYPDHLDGNMISINNSQDCNKTILIIKDPKNYVNLMGSSSNPLFSFFNLIIGIFSNLEHIGIFLFVDGVIILYFAYTKNIVPVKTSIYGMKTIYLKSIDSLIGIFTLITGLYFYFVFGRCPWDIPIINDSTLLSNLYFNMLYSEYYPKDTLNIPHLSILLYLMIVLPLSFFIFLTGTPFLIGESKYGKFFREILREKTFHLTRSGKQHFFDKLKESFILLKEKFRKIDQNDQKSDEFQSKSRKNEETLKSPKT